MKRCPDCRHKVSLVARCIYSCTHCGAFWQDDDENLSAYRMVRQLIEEISCPRCNGDGNVLKVKKGQRTCEGHYVLCPKCGGSGFARNRGLRPLRPSTERSLQNEVS